MASPIQPRALALDATKLLADIKEQWTEHHDVLAADVGLFCPVCGTPLETTVKDSDLDKVGGFNRSSQQIDALTMIDV